MLEKPLRIVLRFWGVIMIPAVLLLAQVSPVLVMTKPEDVTPKQIYPSACTGGQIELSFVHLSFRHIVEYSDTTQPFKPGFH